MFRILMIALLSLTLTSTASADDDHDSDDGPRCRTVRGKFSSTPNPTCNSPVGVCTIGELTGRIRGSYQFTMNTSRPVDDERLPVVFFYTGDSRIETKKGGLSGIDTGTIDFNPFGSGVFAAMITLTGGTGKNRGATGYLQLRGKLDFNTGGASGDYRGELCR